MKRFITVLLTICCLTSCQKGELTVETEPDITAGLERFSAEKVHADYHPETTYTIDRTDMPLDVQWGTLKDDRLFLMVPVSEVSEYASSPDVTPAYVDLNSGVLRMFCPDALCPHTSNSLCAFSHALYPVYPDGHSAVFVDMQSRDGDIVSRINWYQLDTGEWKVFYECSYLHTTKEDPAQYINTVFLTPDSVIFSVGYDTENEENRQRTSYWRFMEYSVSDGVLEPRTDWVEQDSLQWQEEYDSMYEQYGVSSIAAERPMPEFLKRFWEEGQLYDYIETEQYWYYTHKNTTVYAHGETESGREYEIADHIGGKIYRIPKSAQSSAEEELVFDNFGEFCIQDWMVVGNHLYIRRRDYWENMMMWHSNVAVIRVNMTDHTMKYLTYPR